MMNVKMKISGGFHTQSAAETPAALRSVLSTAWKQGWNLLKIMSTTPGSLSLALSGEHWPGHHPLLPVLPTLGCLGVTTCPAKGLIFCIPIKFPVKPVHQPSPEVRVTLAARSVALGVGASARLYRTTRHRRGYSRHVPRAGVEFR